MDDFVLIGIFNHDKDVITWIFENFKRFGKKMQEDVSKETSDREAEQKAKGPSTWTWIIFYKADIPSKNWMQQKYSNNDHLPTS